MNIFNIMPVWAWIAISGVFFAAGEFLSKKFALHPGWTVFAFILFVDILSIATWLPAIFQNNDLSSTGVVWSVVSLGLTVFVGIVLFGEEMTVIKFAGIALGAISVALLSL